MPTQDSMRSEASSKNRESDLALRKEIDRLEGEIRDLQIALLTSNEHGDLLQEHLHRITASLKAEALERQQAQDKLETLVQAITQEKCDLEILVQILRDQGDLSAEEGEKARVDGLTQIANRRRFDEYLLREWRRHFGTQQPLALLFCDIDHFKLYNDRYGHPAGDECLKLVAKAINQGFRNGDLVARYGGEEFAVVLTNTNIEGARQVAERVRSNVEAAALPHAASLVLTQVTVSIGVGCITPQLEHSNDGRKLIEQAD